MSKNKKHVKVGILAFLGLALVSLAGLWGYSYYMEQQKVNDLYKHGFRLLEEQIATYIVENYSGVSKVEFSPIFINGGDGRSMLTANVVPVVYDEHGNKAYLGRTINKRGYGSYGTADSLNLDIDMYGDEIIEIEDFDNQKIYNLSKYETLPDFAKLKTHTILDENMTALIEEGQLSGIKPSPGSKSEVEIIYNLEIQKGKYWEWQ